MCFVVHAADRHRKVKSDPKDFGHLYFSRTPQASTIVDSLTAMARVICVFNAWPGNFASLSMHELDRLKLVLFEGQMALPQPNFVL